MLSIAHVFPRWCKVKSIENLSINTINKSPRPPTISEYPLRVSLPNLISIKYLKFRCPKILINPTHQPKNHPEFKQFHSPRNREIV